MSSRGLFLSLLILNVLAFVYGRYAESRAEARADTALLQISPEKIRLIGIGVPPASLPQSASLPPPASLPEAASLPQPASLPQNQALAAEPATPAAPVCLEWGSFDPPDATRAAAVLASLDLGENVLERKTPAQYWVYIPPLGNKPDADRKLSELKTLGVTDSVVVRNHAISLGVFSSDSAAVRRLAQLKERGVHSAVMTAHGKQQSVFQIRDPSEALVARIALSKQDFPGTELKAVACGEGQPANHVDG